MQFGGLCEDFVAAFSPPRHFRQTKIDTRFVKVFPVERQYDMQFGLALNHLFGKQDVGTAAR